MPQLWTLVLSKSLIVDLLHIETEIVIAVYDTPHRVPYKKFPALNSGPILATH